MKVYKQIYICILLLIIIFTYPAQVYADNPAPDANQKGSISFDLEYKGHAVSGGSLKIYTVAVIDSDSEDGFVFTKEFSDCGISLKKLETKETANKLSKYASKHNLKGQSISIDSNGKAQIKDLAAGIYLVEQNDRAQGYNPINPFLIRIPMYDGKQYIYNVDASPKVDISKSENPSGGNTPPGKSPGGGNSSHKGGNDSRLPQTGQLWWPVPVFALLGIIFYGYGWKRGRYE